MGVDKTTSKHHLANGQKDQKLPTATINEQQKYKGDEESRKTASTSSLFFQYLLWEALMRQLCKKRSVFGRFIASTTKPKSSAEMATTKKRETIKIISLPRSSSSKSLLTDLMTQIFYICNNEKTRSVHV